jgi:hypothetical protein
LFNQPAEKDGQPPNEGVIESFHPTVQYWGKYPIFTK